MNGKGQGLFHRVSRQNQVFSLLGKGGTPSGVSRSLMHWLLSSLFLIWAGSQETQGQ